MAEIKALYPRLVPPLGRTNRSVLHSLVGSCRFGLRSFLLGIGAFAVVLGIMPGAARWQAANRSEHSGQIAVSKLGGTFTMASADRLRRTGELPGWFYRRFQNRVAHVDLSIDAWVRRGDRRSKGPVTDRDLVVLNQFANLRSLNLRGANVTDDAVELLEEIWSLEELDVSDTQISASGAAKLRSALPICRVIRCHRSNRSAMPSPARYCLSDNRRGLAQFAEPSERFVPVPLSETDFG
jgi:hypothetical protein